jgi:phosphatidylserine decarboxylase precursor
MSTPDDIVERLRQILAQDERLSGLLAQSLGRAREVAREDLDPDVFAALEWPEDLEQYEAYLKGFIRWVPRQTDAPAWRKRAPGERYAEEVGDRLAHFFWLVDQKVDEKQTAIAENSAIFRDWLTEFARQWGSFLDTTESFSPEILASFISNAPEYNIGDSMIDGVPNMPSGWLTFNQFFARQLNSGLRPVSEPASNLVVASPADCIFQHAYGIDSASNIPATTIKRAHAYGNIGQLIEGSRYAESFAGGTFVHYMLPPSAYHRFHLPVSGRVEESFVIHGKVFMQVDLQGHQLKSKDSAETGYEFSQTRGVLTIDTSGSDAGDVGIVAVIPVGMAHVASVKLTAVQGTRCAKGEEFGYFQFGGSDIILLFQEGTDPQVDTGERLRLVGSPAARCTRIAR